MLILTSPDLHDGFLPGPESSSPLSPVVPDDAPVVVLLVGVVHPVEVGVEAVVEPPGTAVDPGAVGRVLVVVPVAGREAHAVVVLQAVAKGRLGLVILVGSQLVVGSGRDFETEEIMIHWIGKVQ